MQALAHTPPRSSFLPEETDKLNGKIVVVNTMSVDPDNKTMHITSEDKRRGTTDNGALPTR